MAEDAAPGGGDADPPGPPSSGLSGHQGPPQGLSNIIPTAGFEGGPVECNTSPTLWSTVQDRVYS